MIHHLIDDSAPASVADVEARLRKLNIEFVTISHPPMFTVDDSRRYRDGAPGGYSKNLFLRNKKGKMSLVTLDENSSVDLRQLGEQIGLGRVSFASPERLMKYLGVKPGAVTPLAVINDVSHCVTAFIDASLMRQEPLHFHPCDNAHTTTISAADLMRFMQDCGHLPAVLELPNAP